MDLGTIGYAISVWLLPLIIALVVPAIAGAQPGTPAGTLDKGRFLGLQQAVEAGLQNHPIVLEANAGLTASSARTDQTKSLYYPQVYANADGSAGAGRINPRFVTPRRPLRTPSRHGPAPSAAAPRAPP